jgi:hypothetical protein
MHRIAVHCCAHGFSVSNGARRSCPHFTSFYGSLFTCTGTSTAGRPNAMVKTGFKAYDNWWSNDMEGFRWPPPAQVRAKKLKSFWGSAWAEHVSRLGSDDVRCPQGTQLCASHKSHKWAISLTLGNNQCRLWMFFMKLCRPHQCCIANSRQPTANSLTS